MTDVQVERGSKTPRQTVFPYAIIDHAPTQRAVTLRLRTLAGCSLVALMLALPLAPNAHAASLLVGNGGAGADGGGGGGIGGGGGVGASSTFGGIGGGGGGGVGIGGAGDLLRGGSGPGPDGGAGADSSGSAAGSGVGGGGGFANYGAAAALGAAAGDQYGVSSSEAVVDVDGNVVAVPDVGEALITPDSGTLQSDADYDYIGIGGGGGGGGDNDNDNTSSPGGDGGTGSLTISSGATVTAGKSVLVGGAGGGGGYDGPGGAGGAGDLTIDDGSNLTVADRMLVGGFAGGNSLILANNGPDSVGGAGGAGTVTVREGASMNIGGGTNSGLTIGGLGTDDGSGNVASGGDGILNLWGSIDLSDGADFIINETGTLNILGEETVGSISGVSSITNNGAIVFDHEARIADEYTVSQAITGTGSVSFADGVTYLTGTSTYSGATSITDASVFVDGAINQSTITVSANGALGGTGTLQDVVVDGDAAQIFGSNTIRNLTVTNGQHLPGLDLSSSGGETIATLGTQTVTGDYILGTGSTFVAILSGTGTMNRLAVTGDVDVTDGVLHIADLSYLGQPNAEPFNGEDSLSRTIIENSGSDAVTGQFASTENDLAFYDAAVDYAGGDGNDVVVNLTRKGNGNGGNIGFTDVARPGNEMAVARQIDSLGGADGDDIRNSILGLSTEGAQHAFDQLSGDVYAAGQAVNNQVTQQADMQVGNRIAALRAGGGTGGALAAAGSLTAASLAGFGTTGPMASDVSAEIATDAPMLGLESGYRGLSGSAVWLQGIGGKGTIDGDAVIDDTDYKWMGMIGGYDARLSDRTSIGVYFGYADGESRQSDRDATLDSDSIMVGVYGNHDLGNDWAVTGQAGWTRVDVDSSRHLNFGGIDRTASTDYTDNIVNATAELSRGFDVSPSWRVEPYGGLGIEWAHSGSFNETGADAANLSRESDDDFTGTTTLGVRTTGVFALTDGKLIIPQAGLAWDHHLGSDTTSSTLSFDGADSFNVTGSDLDRDTLIGHLGIALTDPDGWSVYSDYTPSVSENRTEHAFSAGFRIKL